jgi:hypothetical protein
MIISGMSASGFKTEEKGFYVFIANRFQRLIVPLLVCLVVYLIPRLYIA